MSAVLHRLVTEEAVHFVSTEVLTGVIPPRIDWLLLCDDNNESTIPMDIGAFQQRNFVHTHTLAIKIKMVSLLLDEFDKDDLTQWSSHSARKLNEPWRMLDPVCPYSMVT